MSKVETTIKQTNVGLKELLVQLQELTNLTFSGSLQITIGNHQNWTLWLRLGRLSWSDGGTNSQERWQRHLGLFVPELKGTRSNEIASIENTKDRCSILVQLLHQGLIQRQQLTELMLSVTGEILFDLIQSSQVKGNCLSYEIIRDDSSNKHTLILPMIEVIPTLKQTLQTWQQWQNDGLASYSPNLIPVIQQPELISNESLSENQLSIIALIDGMENVRSLALKTGLDIVTVILCLLPLVKLKAISFSKVPRNQKSCISPNRAHNNKKTLIACVDDSPGVCRALHKIINREGLSFVGIQEPLKAIPSFLKNKPDLIFLDLVMPITNGYELCTQLRKTPSLKNVPVIILTGKDGLVDRMRAKMVGANDFVSKPVKVKEFIKVLNKHLTQSTQKEST
ncbi:MAG: response regulator [Crocosphaera sp.]|nr:response regulator [Crocosphaera sp.]